MTAEHDSTDPRVAGNTASRYLSLAVTMVIGFLLTPFLIRSIGKPGYGLQSLSHQALEFVSMAALAIGISYDRLAAAQYARGEYDRMNATLSAGLMLSMLISLVVVIGAGVLVVYAGVLLDVPDDLLATARWVLVLFGAGSVFHIINAVYRSPVFISHRLYLDSFGSVLAYVVSAGLVIPMFIFVRPSIVTWVALTIGARVASQWFFVIPMARRGLDHLKIRLFAPGARKAMRRLAEFSGLAFIGSLGGLLYYATDSIMISNLDELGIAQVANYTVAQRWHPQLTLLATGFIGVLGPVMTTQAALGRLGELRATVTKAVRYCFIILSYPCVLLVVYAEPFLKHWLKSAFVSESVLVMQLIMAGLLVSGMGLVCLETLYACQKVKRATVATLIGGVLNIVLSVSLVKWGGLGLAGIALGSVISLVLLNAIFMPLSLCRELTLDWRALLWPALRALIGAVPLAAASLVLRRLWMPGSLPEVFAQFLVCGLVYAPLVWFVSLTRSDRRALPESVRTGVSFCRAFWTHWRDDKGVSE